MGIKVGNRSRFRRPWISGSERKKVIYSISLLKFYSTKFKYWVRSCSFIGKWSIASWNDSIAIFKRENREIPVAQLLSTYDRAVVHFKIVYKTSFGHITIHLYRRLRKNNFNYAVVQDYNTSILSSLETRPYYKTVLAQRRHNQSLLSATTTYSIVN